MATAAIDGPVWFLGTLARIKLDGAQTQGRFALIEFVAPRGAAPPLHSHPQDETFYVVDGNVTAWVVDDPGRDWVGECATACSPGDVVSAPAGTAHSFRVESDTARMIILSTPAGIEDYIRAVAEPAQWPWLPPPAAGPRVPPERLAAVERELDVVRHGPPPPPLPATE
jgi:quercetin dioxygenase-like cupin family protein